MSVTLAEGVVLVTADGSKITKELAEDIRRSQGPLEDAGDTSRRSFTDVFKGSFFGSWLGNLASGLTSAIGEAIGTGLRSAVDFAIGTIDIASNLNESKNAVNVAFGDMAGSILALGEDSAKTFGLSAGDLNGYAVQFSAFAKGIAGEGGDVTGTFESILGRATDFASVYNIDVASALELFQSGLAGETEPLRKFGKDLSAATVEAWAYASGIAAPGEPLTEQQKVMARYGALLEQTSDVQGDFANTSDELANKNRINAATWEDIQAKIGEGFLPIAESLAGVLTDTVLPAIAGLAEEYGPQLAGMFADLTPALEGFVTDVLPKLPELLTLVAENAPGFIDFLSGATTFIIDMAGKFQLGGEQIGAFFDGLFRWSQEAGVNLGILLLNVGSIVQGIINWFSQAGTNIGNFFGSIGGFIGTAIGEFGNFASEVGVNIGKAIDWVASLPSEAMNAIGDLGSTLFSAGEALVGGFIDGIEASVSWVGDAVGGVVDFITGFFPNSPAKRGPLSGAGWTKLGQSGHAIAAQFRSGIQSADFGGIPFGDVAAAGAYGGASSTSAASRYVGAPASSSLGDVSIVVNEAQDPLGSAGRIGKELRKFARG